MSVERGVDAFAGFMVLLSVALTSFVHPGFVWLTVFGEPVSAGVHGFLPGRNGDAQARNEIRARARGGASLTGSRCVH
jgi:hypothetical protein